VASIGRARWRAFEVIVECGGRTWRDRQVEPDRALHGARWEVRSHGPACPDDIHEANALARLVAGETLVAHCVDGTDITVAPVAF
jgi:hypothetical protein